MRNNFFIDLIFVSLYCINLNYMKQFIKPSTFKERKKRPDKTKVDEFIEKFNKLIKKGELEANDVLNKLPYLNESEFNLAVAIARENGWQLTQFEDNYNTTSYQLTEIKLSV
jgi:hypothetical protein